MNKLFLILIAVSLWSCGDDSDELNVAWDESVDGEISGDMSNPSVLSFEVGSNLIRGGSVPQNSMECATFPGGPPEPIIPYMPNHESYTDVFSFTIPEGSELTAINVNVLEVEQFHMQSDYPCLPATIEESEGAFNGMNNSNQIDWNSNSVLEFISLPVDHPLIGIGFVKATGDNMLAKFKQDFPLPGYDNVNSSSLVVGPGVYTYWWKEGANKVTYELDFVVD